MEKLKSAVSVIGLITLGAVGAKLSERPLPNKHVLKLVNVKLVRGELPDGGVTWNGRACGYDQVDGGTVSEPCWPVQVPAAAFHPTSASVLDQYK